MNDNQQRSYAFGYYRITPEVLWEMGIGPSAQRIWSVLWSYSRFYGFCQVTTREISRSTLLGQATVRRGIKELRAAGLLVIKESQGASSVYAPIWPKDEWMCLNRHDAPHRFVTCDDIFQIIPKPLTKRPIVSSNQGE